MEVTFCYVIIHETLERHIPIITDITELSLGLIDERYMVDMGTIFIGSRLSIELPLSGFSG